MARSPESSSSENTQPTDGCSRYGDTDVSNSAEEGLDSVFRVIEVGWRRGRPPISQADQPVGRAMGDVKGVSGPAWVLTA